MAFGAMTFGSGEGAMASVAKVDQKLADQLVHQAIHSGVNFFNTADVYADGQSEEMLGRALGKRRREVAIATKVGFRTGESITHQGLSRAHILASVDESLRRLGTDYIDVYLAHRLDPYTPVEETLEALSDVARQGKARYVGFSNWPAWLAAKAVGLQNQRGWARFRAAEMYYSLVGRDLEQEIAPFTQDAGIGILVWSPLAAGFLTGRYTRENPRGDGGRLAGFDILPFDRQRGYDIVDKLKAVAAARGASPAQIALAWMLAKSFVTSVLIGASKARQLEENLAALEIRLSQEEMAELDRLSAAPPVYPNWFNQNIKDTRAAEALGEAGRVNRAGTS
jgi:aryl-alcohol dehydrogenase-like predicted oxidoreductase